MLEIEDEVLVFVDNYYLKKGVIKGISNNSDYIIELPGGENIIEDINSTYPIEFRKDCLKIVLEMVKTEIRRYQKVISTNEALLAQVTELKILYEKELNKK